MKHVDLMIPGPVEVSREVLQEMASPMVWHRSSEALSSYRECALLLAKVFGTEGDVLIMNGSGSVAFDACVGSLIRDNDAVIACVNGYFGMRNREIALTYGARAIDVTTPEGSPITAEAVRNCIKSNIDARAVLVVHHETSTGILNPIAEIGSVAREYGIPVIVDAVSSLGIDPLEMDKWGISMCASSPQKGLEAPPGLGLVAINASGWDAVETRQPSSHGWHSNLRMWRSVRSPSTNEPSFLAPPVTQAINNIRALHCSLQEIMREGLLQRIERHARIARIARAGIRNMGFKTLPDDRWASNCITAVVNTLDIDVQELLNYLYDEYQIEIGGGIASLAGKIFRIGHVGLSASQGFVIRAMFGIEQFLRKKGRPIRVGAGLVGFA